MSVNQAHTTGKQTRVCPQFLKRGEYPIRSPVQRDTVYYSLKSTSTSGEVSHLRRYGLEVENAPENAVEYGVVSRIQILDSEHACEHAAKIDLEEYTVEIDLRGAAEHCPGARGL